MDAGNMSHAVSEPIVDKEKMTAVGGPGSTPEGEHKNKSTYKSFKCVKT